jgi:thiol-disulfide isomerase/thioredoxin
LRRAGSFALAAALLLAACGDRAGGPPQVGERVPDYAAVALEGGAPVALAELRGSPVLLNVWATWCKPCQKEMPDLQRLHASHGPRGLRIVGVSVDEGGQEADVREFLRGYGVTYTNWLDPAEKVMNAFYTQGVPSTFLIGRDGTLLWKHLGPLRSDDAELNRLLDRALAEG